MNPPINARFRLAYSDFCLDVDLSLPGSGVSVLFGHSGSGKTSLLRCIAGLQRAEQGYLQVDGQVWQDSQYGLFVPTHKRALGYVFQEANLFPHLSVQDNLQFGLKRSGRREAVELPHILELLGIEHLLRRMPANLSGGERQRVAIARALALQPQILLMDEPLAALDFKRKQEILPFLKNLNRELKIPVLYVTHAQQEVAQLADHLVMMEQGKVLASGPLTETLSRLDVPTALDRDAAMVWPVEVTGHEAEYHMTEVAFDGGNICMPMLNVSVGTPLRLQIYARDVSITLQRPEATSILNVLPAIVTELADDDSGHVVVQLRLGNQPLLAHITQKSAKLLGLQNGMAVFVQIKGTSILN